MSMLLQNPLEISKKLEGTLEEEMSAAKARTGKTCRERFKT